MKYKLLGRTGLRVSELCLGAGTFGTNWGPLGSDKAESRRIFDAFAEAGGNFLDTSNRYQEGMSEELLGEFVHSDRDRFVIGSKYSLYDTFAMMHDPNASGNHRKNMMRSVEGSLRRLQTEYIDLLWVHIWDFTTPVEEVLRGIDDLVRQGKVCYAGASNVPAWICSQANTIADFRGWTPFSALQVEYSVVERTPERDFLPMATALDMAVTSWSPLSGGMVTGKYNADRLDASQPHRHQVQLDPEKKHRWLEGLRRNREIMSGVVRFAQEIGRPVVQVSLNFIRQQNIIPIFSARTLDQVKDDLACLEWSLTSEQVERLREITLPALTQPIVQMGYPNDFLAHGSPAIPEFDVHQMTWGYVGKEIESHRPIKYPGTL
jgi:aryl-alcohol dehydrogenase-like predicted oxidoreductase